MDHNLFVTMFGIVLLFTTGVVPMIFEGNPAATATVNPMDQLGDNVYGKMKPGNYSTGTIASIQNDEGGKPTWVLSGYWNASLTQGEARNQSSPASNSTSALKEEMSNKVGTYAASFDMVMTNGSASHKHNMDNFTLAGMSMPNNTTKVYNGTVTITMREGPVHDVPMNATVTDDNIISFWLDPSKIDNHFGNTTIYGIVTNVVKIMKWDPVGGADPEETQQTGASTAGVVRT